MHRIEAFYPKARTGWRRNTAWLAAGIVLVVTLAMLFTFDELPNRLQLVWPAMTDRYALLLSTKLVLLGVFSLPYLLEMKLSRLMRLVSLGCGIVFVGMLVCILCGYILSLG